jgi:hypothetical protein
MTPKEKAKYLIEKFKKIEVYVSTEPTDIELTIGDLEGEETSVECALITINEMIEFVKTMEYSHGIINYLLDVECELNTVILGE